MFQFSTSFVGMWPELYVGFGLRPKLYVGFGLRPKLYAGFGLRPKLYAGFGQQIRLSYIVTILLYCTVRCAYRVGFFRMNPRADPLPLDFYCF